MWYRGLAGAVLAEQRTARLQRHPEFHVLDHRRCAAPVGKVQVIDLDHGGLGREESFLVRGELARVGEFDREQLGCLGLRNNKSQTSLLL